MLRASRFRINYFYQFDRLVKIDYPDMPNVVLQYGAAGALYNAAGRITHVTDQSGITDYQYGKLGETVAEKRQLQSLTGDSRLVSFENDFRYDYLGRMEWMRYPDGEELTYTYDRGGEVKAVTGVKHSHTRTYVAQISYDEFGQRVYLKYGNGVTTNYAYDPNRRWLKEIDTTEKGGKALQRSAYLFDLVGNVSSVTNTAYKTVSQTYSYDDLYQLVGAKGTYTPHEKRRSDIYQQAFAYDDIGNMVEKTSTHQWTSASDDPDGLQYARAYKYDTDRPHTAVRVGGWTYQYDLNGNLLWRGLDDRSREVYDGPGEGHQGGDWLKHDSASSSSSSQDRSLVATQHADEGRDNDHDRGWGEAYKWGFKHWRDPPVGERVQQYSWDSENRLRVAQQDGQSVKFLYDREGNRTVKKGARGETLYVDRYYQVQNRDEAAKHIFVGDTRIATRLSDYDHDDWSYEEASLYYYHPDHLGSTTFVTDRDGDEYQHLEYTPYGESWIDEGSNKHLVGYRFTGKELDEETGLYYYGARYLDPQVSIWLSADPAMGKYLPETPVNDEAKKRNGKLPGEGGVFNPFNLAVYHYANNNPVKYVDPSGNDVGDATARSSVDQRMRNSLYANRSFTSSDSMACDVYVTTVLADAKLKPAGWPDPNKTTVLGYRNKYSGGLSETASPGWNIAIMRSENSTMTTMSGIDVPTDPTPHMGIMYKDPKTGELTLSHYTHGAVKTQHFRNEADFKAWMPYLVYRYDTAEYKKIE